MDFVFVWGKSTDTTTTDTTMRISSFLSTKLADI